MEFNHKLINYIRSVPNIETVNGRRALFFTANLSEFEHRINWEGPTSNFVELLIPELIRCGNTQDGRDPINALLEATKERVGENRKRDCANLQEEWKSNKNTIIRHFLMSTDNQTCRQHYLGKLHERVAYLPMSFISPTKRGYIPLESIYVSLPTNVTLGIGVRDYQIVDWWVGRNKNGDQIFSNISFSKSELGGYNAAVMKMIVDEIQGQIDGKNGEISDEERERSLILAPLWIDRDIENFRKLDAVEVASIAPRLVILGDPGSGKSTLAKYMTLCFLSAQLDPPLDGISLNNLGHWAWGSLTPIFIELRKFMKQTFADPEKEVTADDFLAYVRHEYMEQNDEFSEALLNDLIDGRAIIIFDGIDEVPFSVDEKDGIERRKKQLVDLERSLSIRFRKTRIIFTSRPYGYKGLEEEFERDGFKVAELVPLDKRQMFRLASNLYTVTGIPRKDAINKANDLIKELRAVSDFLKDRPLFLTLMAILSLHGDTEELPNRSGILLQQSLRLLIDRWTKSRIGSDAQDRLKPGETEDLYQKLELIAYNIHSGTAASSSSSPDIDAGQILRELYIDYGNRTVDILNYLTQEAGILVETSLKTFRFHHRTFQEFLAASHLARSENYAKVKQHVQDNPILWREPFLFLGDMLEEKKLWDLLKILVLTKRPKSLEENPNHWYSAWLAGQIVVNRNLYAKKDADPYNEVVLGELSRQLEQLIEIALDMPSFDRVQSARALGFIGDNRQGVGVIEGMPNIAWCKIPNGCFEMGTNEAMMKKISALPWISGWKNFERELPAFSIDVPEFYISRFPITIGQFRAFIDAEDGYFQEKWWTMLGLKFHIQAGLKPFINEKDPPNLPMHHVSWFEALAFCSWLSNRLGAIIRLPTEVEWEWAARGPDDRIFPWGDTYDPHLCNAAETGIGWPSPVGVFVADTPWGSGGPQDMCGNVWEWCSTICEKEGEFSYSYPYKPSDGREDLDAGDEFLRIVRGGSFTNLPILLRNTFRGRDRPFYQRSRQGFRIVKVIKS